MSTRLFFTDVPGALECQRLSKLFVKVKNFHFVRLVGLRILSQLHLWNVIVIPISFNCKNVFSAAQIIKALLIRVIVETLLDVDLRLKFLEHYDSLCARYYCQAKS